MVHSVQDSVTNDTEAPHPSLDSPTVIVTNHHNLSSDEDELNFKSGSSTTETTSSSSAVIRTHSPHSSQSISSITSGAHITQENDDVDDQEAYFHRQQHNSRSTLGNRSSVSSFDDEHHEPVKCDINSSSSSSNSSSGDEAAASNTVAAATNTTCTLSTQTLNQLPSNKEEVVSLSSITSNYSQFDITSLSSSNSANQQLQSNVNNTNKKSTFSFLTKKSTTPNSFEFLTSKFLNLKTSSKPAATTINSNNNSPNSSFTTAVGSAADVQVPSSVLIFENRPRHLPAKSKAESLRHQQEYERMVEVAKKKELYEKELRQKKLQQQMKKEDFMANSLKIWNNEILVNWNELRDAKRTRALWWHGLPPSIRGKIWRLAIGNELNLSKDQYIMYERQSREALNSNGSSDESNVELIKLDVSRTFPQLCFFQRDGPYHMALHSVLGAYACYNKSIGYVQGMSCLAAILLLNMEAPDAFVCLANLLNNKYLLACFRMDQAMMNRYFRVHQILFHHNVPKLYQHFQELKVKPDLYLIEWIFTLFSKSLPLDVVSRVWDVFVRDKDEFLFRTAIGLLDMYKDELIKLDFVHCIQFLTKLPENINATHLFKCIEQVDTTIHGSFSSFQQLIAGLTCAPPSIPQSHTF